jgi:hypothetical protein
VHTSSRSRFLFLEKHVKFRLERVPFAITALVALSVSTFGPGASGVRAALAQATAAPSTASSAGSPAPSASLLQTSPSELTFTATGDSQAKRFVISTSAAGLTATVVNPAIATVLLFSDGATDAATHTFVVTPLAAGSTTIDVQNAIGTTIATLPVTVTNSGAATPVAGAPAIGGSNGKPLLYGIAAAFVGVVALLAAGSGKSINANGAAPTVAPVETATPTISITPTPVGQTPTPVGQTPTPVGQTPTPVGQTPSPMATQTPVPATPTPGPLSVNPNTFSFVIGQAPSTGTFIASEAGYTGSISAVSANTDDATVRPATGTGPSAQFTITPVGPGQTLIYVSDANGNEAAVTVIVTQTNVVVNHRSGSVAPHGTRPTPARPNTSR